MPDFITDILNWLLDALLWIPRQIYKLILEALAAVINAIPVPGFIQTLGTDLANVFSNIAWFAELIMLPEAVTLILAATMLRFLIRRLPFVG